MGGEHIENHSIYTTGEKICNTNQKEMHEESVVY